MEEASASYVAGGVLCTVRAACSFVHPSHPALSHPLSTMYVPHIPRTVTTCYLLCARSASSGKCTCGDRYPATHAASPMVQVQTLTSKKKRLNCVRRPAKACQKTAAHPWLVHPIFGRESRARGFVRLSVFGRQTGETGVARR
jgi:hypothetical protein